MAIVILPKMYPIPKGANKKDRQRLFDEYKIELTQLNHFNGSQKTLWQWLKGLLTDSNKYNR